MLPEHESNHGQPAGPASPGTEPAPAVGRVKPQINPPPVTYSFAITPNMRAWNQYAKTDGRQARAARRLKDRADASWTPLPGWKHAIDLAACLVGLPVLGLCALAMYLLTKCFSPGPVFYRQERIGYLGRRFMLYKFRTMKVGADCSIHQDYCKELIHSNAPMVKLDSRGDARLIPLAWALRAAGLDELPQLINVMRGEMSLVGPRPCTPAEFEHYTFSQRRRCDARPGLTGLWQVSGKNRTTFEEMIRLDIRYARECSFWLDLKIIATTVPCLLTQVRETLQARRTPSASGHRGPPETSNRVSPGLLRSPAVAQGNDCPAS